MTPKEPEIVLLQFMCEPDQLAIDVGANLGLYVHHLFLLTKHVIAFEPLVEMQKVLRRIYGNRIKLEPVALSDSSGSAELKFPEGNYAWATLENSSNLSISSVHHVVSQSTQLKTLDSYTFGNVGIIKIDVEGHEEAVLRGSSNTIRNNRPSLLIEIEERHNKGSIFRISDLLKKYEYKCFFLDDNEIISIEYFDLERDQSSKNIGFFGKTGKYINNFIFIPNDRAHKFHAEATKFLMEQENSTSKHKI